MANVFSYYALIERHHKRKTASEIDLYHQPPTEEEIKIVHNHFVRKYIPGAPVNDNMKKMAGTEMRTVCICQPQVSKILNVCGRMLTD